MRFQYATARNIAFENESEVIAAFDAFGHVMEDEEVLTQMHKSLKPEGLMSLTVSQHLWLWGPVDEYACHVGRYVTPDLHQKIDTAWFQVLNLDLSRKTLVFLSADPGCLLREKFNEI